MNPLEIFRVAARALMRNKTRSFLTTLGIIIGVGCVIIMVAIGEGAKSNVEEAFASMGSNLLILMPGSTNANGAKGGFGSMPTLTWEDYTAIGREISTVRYTAPVLRVSAQVQSEEQNWSTSIYGTTPEYFDIRNWAMALGARFTQSDIDAGAKVVVLGQTVVDKLYGPNANPVGQQVRIRNIPFQVVAVMAKKGQSAMGQDYDDCAVIPWKTFATKIQGGLGKFLNGSMMISAITSDATTKTESQVTNLLRDRHHIQPGTDDDFQIRNLAELAAAQEQGTQTLEMLLVIVAAVSLLVGGIGIMNIMLVSVTERTREIGVRMAIGARPWDILAQFLVEALTLSAAGGVVGVTAGLLIGKYVSAQAHWPMLIRYDVIGVSVVFSALVGIGFGLYPALKASQLDPIDALRYE
jgi:putative ABC transport system permease protein